MMATSLFSAALTIDVSSSDSVAVVGEFVVGQLYSVQYKSFFGAPDKVRCDTREEARPSRLDFQRDEEVLDIKTYPTIASMEDCMS